MSKILVHFNWISTLFTDYIDVESIDKIYFAIHAILLLEFLIYYHFSSSILKLKLSLLSSLDDNNLIIIVIFLFNNSSVLFRCVLQNLKFFYFLTKYGLVNYKDTVM